MGGHSPPKILLPKISPLSESPTQTIESSPCCKTGSSSAPQMKMSGSAPVSQYCKSNLKVSFNYDKSNLVLTHHPAATANAEMLLFSS